MKNHKNRGIEKEYSGLNVFVYDKNDKEEDENAR